MINTSRRIIALLAVALAPLGASDPADTNPKPENVCTLEYQRADNMWAAAGRPDGNLGVETITLASGQGKALDTDWKFEKLRNDGRNYYGSHLRVAKNAGARQLVLSLRRTPIDTKIVSLQPGESQQFQLDLYYVRCA